jgi:hypothetical protein
MGAKLNANWAHSLLVEMRHERLGITIYLDRQRANTLEREMHALRSSAIPREFERET